jgi:hypothetical protein
MTKPKHKFRNIILPAMILFPLLLLMVGCLYIPTFEHLDLVGTRRDFRSLIGDPRQKSSPIQVGRIDRFAVAAFLGSPKFRSPNNRVWAYELRTNQGIWIVPECFYAGSADMRIHMLALKFTDGGVLEQYDLFDQEYYRVMGAPDIPGTYDYTNSTSSEYSLIDQINSRNKAFDESGNPNPFALGSSSHRLRRLLLTYPATRPRYSPSSQP